MARLDPHSFADLEQGQVKELVWRAKVLFAEQRLESEATLLLDREESGPLDLDSRGLLIHSVVDGAGRELAFEIGATEGFMGERLRVQRSHPTQVVTLRYATGPGASALQWLEPSNTAGGVHPYMFSQCQAIHARSIVPLQDTPKARFTFSAEITVPEPLVVVMAAAPGQSTKGDGGWRTFGFHMPQAIPSYLLALAVGDIVWLDLGPRTRVYAEPAMLEASAFEFSDAEAMLHAAEDLFGPYRWERFDFLVMPPAFPYGGMENPRLTFLTPTLLAGDKSMVNVLAHELAHSWTGNLVTNATMNDFWLNEGFTVWAERRILERLEGAEFAALHSNLGWNGLQGALQQFGEGSVWSWLHTNMAGVDPDEVYSLVPYEKGYLFVLLMERLVGRQRFDTFIKAYIDHFKFQSITTQEFVEFLEQQMPGLLEQAQGELWLHGPGIPANAPKSESTRVATVTEALAAYKQSGQLPLAQSKGWKSEEWVLFLQGLERPLSVDACGKLDGAFAFTTNGNSEILCHWLVIAAASGFQPALPAMEAFLKRVGRGKYLKPLYKALMGNPETAAFGRRVFNEAKSGYHPIMRDGLGGLMG